MQLAENGKMELIMEINVQHIKKSYKKGHTEVLKDICFTASSGECIGILGLNGCGKTTLLSCLAGLIPADAGDFLIDGQNLFLQDHLIQELIGYIPQGNPLIGDLSAKDNLRLWYTGSRLDMEKELKDGILKMLGIDRFADKKVSELSGGMKKRLSIGCAVANNPKLLLMDEPSASLDIDCKKEIADYIALFKENGGAVIIATHEEHEILLCDRTYIMKSGKLFEYTFTDVAKLTSDLKDEI